MESKFIPLDDLNGKNGSAPDLTWIRLSDNYRRLVTEYVAQNYDKVAAVKAIYKGATRRSVISTVARTFGNADVKAFLAKHFGMSDLDVLQEEIRRVLRSPKISQQRLSALRLLARAQGISLSVLNEVEASAEKVVADKIIERDGKRYRTKVTEVTDNDEA